MNLTTYLAPYKTKWFIAKAKECGIKVVGREPAPNGGEVIHFKKYEGNKTPYFMIWTGNGKDYKWHAEFGHWYVPKNKKEEKEYPPTEYYDDDKLEQAIEKYARNIKLKI